MSEIDHKSAKAYAVKRSAPMFEYLDEGNLARAYIDMVKQRDYWRTIVQGGVGELPLENNAHAVQGDEG